MEEDNVVIIRVSDNGYELHDITEKGQGEDGLDNTSTRPTTTSLLDNQQVVRKEKTV